LGQSLIGDFTGHICVSYSPTWNDVLRTMFGGSLGTSIDYPNVHRKLFKGGAVVSCTGSSFTTVETSSK
jgi:hypothetical protein